MASVINAKDVVVKKNGVLVGCAKSASIKMQRDMDEATCSSSDDYKEFTAGFASWTSSFSAVYREFSQAEAATNVSFEDLFDSFTDADLVTLEFGKKNGTGTRYTGKAFMSGLNLDFPEKGAVTWSADFQGTGAISKIV